jgi:hypothetical protein
VFRQKLGVFVGARDRRRNLGRCARFQTMLTRIAARDFKRRCDADSDFIFFTATSDDSSVGVGGGSPNGERSSESRVVPPNGGWFLREKEN